MQSKGMLSWCTHMNEGKIDFQYRAEYFAEKRREKVKLSLSIFSDKKRISPRNFSAFRGEISLIETRNFDKFTVHFAEKKHPMIAEKREKWLFFFTLAVCY